MTEHGVHDAHRHDDGAYVLGALAEDEQVAFEQHLRTCADCRERVAEIHEVPALLVDVGAADLDADLDPDHDLGGPPDTLLPGLLRRAGEGRRTRRRVVAGLAALAAACLVALAVALWPSPDPSPGSPAPRALTPVVASPVQADAVLVAKAWGTEINLHCRYGKGVKQGFPYLLVVRDRHGRPENLGTWLLPPGDEISFSAGTALHPSQIAQVDVALTDGTPILRLQN